MASAMARESEFLFPKQHLPGSVHIEWKRCGRPWCHCASGGQLHGPYFYRRWRENGRQKKQYVKLADLWRTLEAIKLKRFELPPMTAIKTSLDLAKRSPDS